MAVDDAGTFAVQFGILRIKIFGLAVELSRSCHMPLGLLLRTAKVNESRAIFRLPVSFQFTPKFGGGNLDHLFLVGFRGVLGGSGVICVKVTS